MVPQMVDNVFHKFLRESSCGGLNKLFLPRGLRPDVFIECGLQPREKRKFLGLDLCASSVNRIPQNLELGAYLHVVCDAWAVVVEHWQLSGDRWTICGKVTGERWSFPSLSPVTDTDQRASARNHAGCCGAGTGESQALQAVGDFSLCPFTNPKKRAHNSPNNPMHMVTG